MPVRLDQLPADIRETTVAALRPRRPKLVRDPANGLSIEQAMGGVSLPDSPAS